MSIHVLFGPGGSGKSLYQMHLLVDQLRHTRRNVVTNLAVLVPALNAYLDRTYPREKIDLVHRFRLLSDVETREFWKIRGPRLWRVQDTPDGAVMDFVDDPGTNGVCYIIDEAGAAGFSAQGWAATDARTPRGLACTEYLDQQRKHGDDVFASTNGRTPNQIAKGFRDKAHFFIKLKNGYLHQMGVFKGQPKFTWRKYTEEPGNTSEPMASGSFHLDKNGLMDCYVTEQGVGGVLGSGADKGARAKGIPTWVIWPAVAVAALSCVLVPLGLGKAVGKFGTGGGSGAKVAPVSQAQPGVALADMTGRSPAVGSQVVQAPAAAPTPTAPSQQPVWVRGITWDDRRVNVYLSDGRILSEQDRTLKFVGRNFVDLLDGSRIWMQNTVPDRGARTENSLRSQILPLTSVDRSQDKTENSGSWVTDRDGVQRLRSTPSLVSPDPARR